MNYFYIEPEVAGGLGPNTAIDRAIHPPVITKLHYHFEGWLGDVLLETFPSFIVTDDARHQLQAACVTGVKFDTVEITTSDQFRHSYPNRPMPKFVWLQVEGRSGRDDFGTVPDGRLVVSARALEILSKLGIANALVTQFQN